MKRRTVADADHAGPGALTEHLFTAAAEDLEFLAARGVGLTEGCRRVGWTPGGFEKWCDRNKRRDLYATLLRNERPAGSLEPAPLPAPKRRRVKETSQGVLDGGAAVA